MAAPFVLRFDLQGLLRERGHGQASQDDDATVNDLVVDSQENAHIAGVMPAAKGIEFLNASGSSPVTPDMPTREADIWPS